MFSSSLVSVEWLASNLALPNLVILDATWFLPKFERSGREEYVQEHIEGAHFFDYDQEICDKSSAFPRMMPSVLEFEKAVQKLGVNNDSQIVIYDNNEMFSSPRAWWMFKAMGAQQVAVLDGGLVAWKKAGHPTVDTVVQDGQLGNFKAHLNEKAFIDSKKVLDDLKSAQHLVMDARSKDRFDEAHMPGAMNLPYTELLESGKMKSSDELKSIYSKWVSKGQSLTCSCGSGVTACILALGADLSGVENISVYDASWSEWGQDESFPKESSDP